MNFVFIITNLAGGGAEKVILQISESLKQNNHSVRIILLENVINYEIPNGVSVESLTERIHRGVFGKYIMAFLLRRRVKLLKGVDCLISSLPFANEIAYLARLKNIWFRIDNNLGEEIKRLNIKNPGKSKRRLQRYKKIYNKAKLVAVSQGVLDNLVELGINAKIVRIYNPFDIEKIKELSLDKNLEIPEYEYAIHVGRFNYQKRHDVLLDAWKLANPGIKLVLLTDNLAKIKDLINSKRMTHEVCAFNFQANPFNWIKHAKLMIVSSDFEGFGNVIVESLICDTPVVSTDCNSGPREILGKIPKSLARVSDSIDLAEVIKYNLNSPYEINIDLNQFNTTSIVKEYEMLAKKKND